MTRILSTSLLLFLTISLFAQIKISRGPYLQNVSETEATIVWKTDKNSIGWVEIAPNDDNNFYFTEQKKVFDSSLGIKNVSELHSVTLKGLNPGTTYKYRVYSQEAVNRGYNIVDYGRITALDVYYNKPLTLTTNDRTANETSFVMINDIHSKKEWIPQLFEAAKYTPKDLIIFNGDMVSDFTSEDVIFDGFLDTSIKLFAKEKPFYYVRGNHETRGSLAASFHKYFNTGEPYLYYIVRQGPVCFIMLDTGEDKPDSDIEYYGLADYDAFRDEQISWLAQALESEEYKTAEFKVIVAHVPPGPEKDMWHGNKEVLEKFVPLLNKANVDVMLCGHLHEYVRMNQSNQINFPVIINSNDMVVKGQTKNNKLNLEVFDLKGKRVDELTIKH